MDVSYSDLPAKRCFEHAASEAPLPKRSSVEATLLAEQGLLAVIELFGDATGTVAFEPVEEALGSEVRREPQEQVDVLGHDDEGGEAGAVALHGPKEQVCHQFSPLRPPEERHEVENGGCGHHHLTGFPAVDPVLIGHTSSLPPGLQFDNS